MIQNKKKFHSQSAAAWLPVGLYNFDCMIGTFS